MRLGEDWRLSRDRLRAVFSAPKPLIDPSYFHSWLQLIINTVIGKLVGISADCTDRAKYLTRIRYKQRRARYSLTSHMTVIPQTRERESVRWYHHQGSDWI